ncbi:cardiolipin synthase [Candidatus Latescibacterota bacterium]
MEHILFVWSIVLIVGSWAIRLVMLVVLLVRKRTRTAVSWLLVIFFMPWLGLFLYLLIGEYTLPHRRIGLYRCLQEQFSALQQKYIDNSNLVRYNFDPWLQTTVDTTMKLTGMPVLRGNEADIITWTNDFADLLITDIDHAVHTVHLMFYIYSNDSTGRRVSEALIAAVKRGVTCRILVDAVGSRLMMKTLAEYLTQNGVHVHEALKVNIFRFYLARMDIRNHRKIAVIDGRIAYTGSQNISNPGYHERKNLAWHDMMVRLTGPVVLELQSVFVGDWYSETGEIIEGSGVYTQPQQVGNISIQTLPSGPTYPIENYQSSVVAALYAAQREVTITTPYFVPEESFMQALRVAAKRGVRVGLIIPEISDHSIVGAASRAFFDELLEAGVSIYLYKIGILHTKSMIIDDSLAFVGSSNFDIRSFSLNFEINLVFIGAPFIRQLKELHYHYQLLSIHITREQWAARPFQHKIAQNVANLFSPLL